MATQIINNLKLAPLTPALGAMTEWLPLMHPEPFFHRSIRKLSSGSSFAVGIVLGLSGNIHRRHRSRGMRYEMMFA
jgi:hypothetical protein